MTSYGPVTSSASVTPAIAAICRATSAALPTSVWTRMYACTMASSWRQRRTAAPDVSRYRSGPDRYRAGRIVLGPVAAPGHGAGTWRPGPEAWLKFGGGDR